VRGGLKNNQAGTETTELATLHSAARVKIIIVNAPLGMRSCVENGLPPQFSLTVEVNKCVVARFANGDKCTLRNRTAFRTLSSKNSSHRTENYSMIAGINVKLKSVLY
jgi:hypothetical protein